MSEGVITIGVDGIGGDTTKEGPPHVRALYGISQAKLDDVAYVLAVEKDARLPYRLPNLEVVEFSPSSEVSSQEKSLANGDFLKLKQQNLLSQVIEYFSSRKMPLVTAFNTRIGLPNSLRNRIPGIKRIALAVEFPRENSGGPYLALDLGGNADLYDVRDIEEPPKLPDGIGNDPGAVREYVAQHPDEASAYILRQKDYNDKLRDIFMPSRQYARNAMDVVKFARLGSLYMTIFKGVQNPRVGLVNIGTEDDKGTRFVQSCNALLEAEKRQNGLNYLGFAEPDDVDSRHIDVMVMDGYSGNLGLKFIEKTIRVIKAHSKKSLFGKIATALKHLGLSNSIDASQYSAAYLLGLSDTIVKEHGTATPKDFAAGIRKAKAFMQPVVAKDHNDPDFLRNYDCLGQALSAEYKRRYG
ncbi:MAG: hypothetical protein QXM31_02500 [Candidatus Woesearchaeota archaeon]